MLWSSAFLTALFYGPMLEPAQNPIFGLWLSLCRYPLLLISRWSWRKWQKNADSWGNKWVVHNLVLVCMLMTMNSGAEYTTCSYYKHLLSTTVLLAASVVMVWWKEKTHHWWLWNYTRGIWLQDLRRCPLQCLTQNLVRNRVSLYPRKFAYILLIQRGPVLSTQSFF